MQDWSIDVMEILINTDRLAESKSSAVSRKFNLYSLSLKKKRLFGMFVHWYSLKKEVNKIPRKAMRTRTQDLRSSESLASTIWIVKPNPSVYRWAENHKFSGKITHLLTKVKLDFSKNKSRFKKNGTLSTIIRRLQFVLNNVLPHQFVF